MVVKWQLQAELQRSMTKQLREASQCQLRYDIHFKGIAHIGRLIPSIHNLNSTFVYAILSLQLYRYFEPLFAV